MGGGILLSPGDYGRFAVHHSVGNWDGQGVRESRKQKKAYKCSKLKSLLRQPKSFEFVEIFFGNSILKIYVFAVYDLAEYGCLYYIKKFLPVRFKTPYNYESK